MGVEPDWIRAGLSMARFEPYLRQTNGDLPAAIALYWWNVSVSAAFYAPLHILEVTLRNSLHEQLITHFHRADWWDEPALLRRIGRQMVKDARYKLEKRGRAASADDVVAELPLGFWVSLVSSAYDRNLWVPYLHRAFPNYDGPRAPLHTELDTIRMFRNRVMHHEPIHRRDLEADHQLILRVLGYLSTEMVEQLKPYDRVPSVLGQRPAQTGRGSD